MDGRGQGLNVGGEEGYRGQQATAGTARRQTALNKYHGGHFDDQKNTNQQVCGRALGWGWGSGRQSSDEMLHTTRPLRDRDKWAPLVGTHQNAAVTRNLLPMQ